VAGTLALVPFVLANVFLSRVSGECRISADDAMGAGIDFMALIALELTTLAVLAATCIGRARYQRKKPFPR